MRRTNGQQPPAPPSGQPSQTTSTPTGDTTIHGGSNPQADTGTKTRVDGDRHGNSNIDTNSRGKTNAHGDPNANPNGHANPSGNSPPNGDTGTSGDTHPNGSPTTGTKASANEGTNPGNAASTNGNGDAAPNNAPPTSTRQHSSPSPLPGSGKPPSTSAAPTPSQQPQATANHGQPPQTPPSGPPLSVERSRRLIANIMARPEHARQHPTTQADLAQAQAVMGAANETHNAASNGPEASSLYEAGARPPTKGLNERSAQNKRLSDSRPPRRHAPSTTMEVQAWGSHGEAIRKAVLLTDHAHDDGTLPKLTLNAKDVPSNADGVYRHPDFPYPGRIGVRPECPYPVFTTFHEIGHHVRTALDPHDVAVIAEAARQTRGSQKCRALGMNAGYWLSDSELFSRVYAQWVAERVSKIDGEAFHELDAIKSSGDSWQQFGGNEWTTISSQMTLLLKRKGWL